MKQDPFSLFTKYLATHKRLFLTTLVATITLGLIETLTSSNESDFWKKLHIGSTAQAKYIASQDNTSNQLSEDLKLEASGLTIIDSKSLLIVSDSNGPNGSPFWQVPLNNFDDLTNLTMTGLKRIEDLESVTTSHGKMYAMTSLSMTKSGKIKPHRNLLVRFKLENSKVQIDRAIDIRTPLLEGIKNIAILNTLETDKLEVEAFSIEGNDGFLALKKPKLPDGSSVVLKIKNMVINVEEANANSLEIEVYTLLKLKYKDCIKTSRITDMTKTSLGLILLSTCSREENSSQVWWLGNNLPADKVVFLDSFNSILEGMAYSKEIKTLYLASDTGSAEIGSDLISISIDQEL